MLGFMKPPDDSWDPGPDVGDEKGQVDVHWSSCNLFIPLGQARPCLRSSVRGRLCWSNLARSSMWTWSLTAWRCSPPPSPTTSPMWRGRQRCDAKAIRCALSSRNSLGSCQCSTSSTIQQWSLWSKPSLNSSKKRNQNPSPWISLLCFARWKTWCHTHGQFSGLHESSWHGHSGQVWECGDGDDGAQDHGGHRPPLRQPPPQRHLCQGLPDQHHHHPGAFGRWSWFETKEDEVKTTRKEVRKRSVVDKLKSMSFSCWTKVKIHSIWNISLNLNLSTNESRLRLIFQLSPAPEGKNSGQTPNGWDGTKKEIFFFVLKLH